MEDKGEQFIKNLNACQSRQIGANMIFITGGAYQGKEAYAREHFPGDYRIINAYHLKVREQLSAGEDPRKIAERLLAEECVAKQHPENKNTTEKETLVRDLTEKNLTEKNLTEKNLTEPKGTELVIISDEVGCGVVPVDDFERSYREAVGRVNCFFAERADQVIRVVCGIGIRIK